MEAKANRKIGADPIGWYERRALRWAATALLIAFGSLVVMFVFAAWQWLEAAMQLVSAASTRAQGAMLLAAVVVDARHAPRNLQQLIADDAEIDSAFMAEICRIGSERWLEVREQEGADHAADQRREREESGE